MSFVSSKFGNSKAEARQTLAVLLVSFGMVSYGSIGCWNSPALEFFLSSNPPVKLTDSQLSWVTSAICIGSMVGPVMSASLMDLVGRRNCLHLLNILPVVSWILTFFATSFPTLFIARCIAGTWPAVAVSVIPVYISEIVDPNLRSSSNTLSIMFSKIGVLTMFILGECVSYWTLNVLGLFLSLLVWFTLLFIPESPHYYIIINQKTNAMQSLRWFQGDENIQEKFKKIDTFVESELKNKETVITVFFKLKNCKTVLVVIALTILSITSGACFFSILSIIIPKKAFFSMTNQDCTIVMGFINLLFGYRPKRLSKFGNKPLLVVSGSVCGVCMAIMAVWYYFNNSYFLESTILYWIPFVSYSVFVAFYSLCMYPIVTALRGEMFTTKLKSTLSGIVTIFENIGSFMVLKSFIPIQENLGNYYNFVIASVSCFGLVLVTHFYLTETEGKSLEEIQIELANNSNKSSEPSNQQS